MPDEGRDALIALLMAAMVAAGSFAVQTYQWTIPYQITAIIPVWYYAENTTRGTASGVTDWVDHLALTVSPAAAENYVIIANALVSISNATEYAFVRLLIDGTEYAYENMNAYGAGGSNRFVFGTHKRIEFGAGGHTIKIQYKDTTVDVGDVYIDNSAIIAIKVTDESPTAENEALGTTTSTTYVDRASLNFTSASDNYLVLGSAEISNADPGTSTYVQLTRATTSQGEMRWEAQDGSVEDWYTYVGVRLFTLPAGAQDFRIQYKTESATYAARIRQARVTAAKLSDIGGGSWTAENETGGSTNSLTYVDVTTLDFTAPATDNYLVLASALLNHNQNDAESTVNARLLVDSGPYGEVFYRPNDTSDYMPFFVMRRLELAGGAHSLKIQFRAGEADPGELSSIKNARIIVIREPV